MTPAIAIGIIGGGLIAAKVFGNTPVADKMKDEQGQNNTSRVGTNADTIGYERIDETQYQEQGGVEAGQSHTVINGNGEVVGEVVGLEGGNQVFQEADGTVHIRSEGEPEIEPLTVANVSSPGHKGGVVGTVAKVGNAISANPTPAPRLTFTKPKRAVSSALSDKRIRDAARGGLRLPM
jgi:hypothetical protein